MNRLIFIVLFLGVIACLEWYAYSGLKVAIGGFGESAQRAIKVAFFSLTAFTVASVVLFQPMSENPASRRILAFVVTIGLANLLGKLLFALFLLIDDLVRLFRWLWVTLNPKSVSPAEGSISRMQFITQVGAVATFMPTIGMTWGIVSGAHDYRVIKREIPIKGLPSAFDGFTITQISDIHCGSFWSPDAVMRGVELVNKQQSQVIFFTGDAVNSFATELDDWIDVFGQLSAPHGVFSILGNHDYGDYVQWPDEASKAANFRHLLDLHEAMGWKLLRNENSALSNGNEQLTIVGVENWSARGRFHSYGDLDKALAGAPSDTVKLLLSHDPSHWRAQVLGAHPDIALTCSGHTHGMQFGIEVGKLKWSPVKYFYPEWADLYTENSQHLYVNRGFGYIGYPGRLGIRPEITVLTLRAV
ncbi:MAG: hypothetical protein Kow0075_12870 [Salibacteraceae bacterium]